MYISLPDSENSVYHLPIRAVTIKKKKINNIIKIKKGTNAVGQILI